MSLFLRDGNFSSSMECWERSSSLMHWYEVDSLGRGIESANETWSVFFSKVVFFLKLGCFM